MTIVLGAGMTGLAAGGTSGAAVFDAEAYPGGICSSYYLPPGSSGRLHSSPADGEAYRFEIGGGHWIFGGDPIVLQLIRRLVPIRSYERISSVFFPDEGTYVPYPIQNHLAYLGPEIAQSALREIVQASCVTPRTMEDWIRQSFGETLTERFFGPFHDLYTAGLWTDIRPQDSYKSPVDVELAIRGAFDRTPAVGYNTTFVYPEPGLDRLSQALAAGCDVRYGKRAVSIDLKRQEVQFEDGSDTGYDALISTLPLSVMLKLTGVDTGERADPYSSVLVLNIGAKRGDRCPPDHWLYVPRSRSGFHRVGFYSNVDTSFLPASHRDANDRVSIYVERAFREGQRPDDAEVARYQAAVASELQEWGWIEEVEVSDPTWIEVAYTWSWPEGRWAASALERLERGGVWQAGRYGRWVFQGIAASIREGAFIGTSFRDGA